MMSSRFDPLAGESQETDLMSRLCLRFRQSTPLSERKRGVMDLAFKNVLFSMLKSCEIGTSMFPTDRALCRVAIFDPNRVNNEKRSRRECNRDERDGDALLVNCWSIWDRKGSLDSTAPAVNIAQSFFGSNPCSGVTTFSMLGHKFKGLTINAGLNPSVRRSCSAASGSRPSVCPSRS
jgi:hypothetical protein